MNDSGLHAGSRIRLVRSSSLSVSGMEGGRSDRYQPLDLDNTNLEAMLMATGPGPSVLGFAFFPWDPNHFVVQSANGQIAHRTRFGTPGPPREFSCDPLESLSPVTAVAFSPFQEGYFLAGCSDGSLRLHTTACESPLLMWSAYCFTKPSRSRRSYNSSPPQIIQTEWSPQRPAVFFVLDSAGVLHVFDILQDDKAPILSELIDESASHRDADATLSFAIGSAPSMAAFIAITASGRTMTRTLAPALCQTLFQTRENESKMLSAHLEAAL